MENKKYDFLIVGAGLFGSVCARELTDKGYKCLVIDKRPHIAGNIYTENIENINVHKYGAHIFHTNKKQIYDYLSRFCTFNNYINSPIARYKNEIYNLPFNMNTFSKLFNVITPAEAAKKIEEEKRAFNITNPKNLEEQAISLVGITIYQKLVKEYTEKQWGKDCRDLPAFIIKRLPVRFTYNNNYFNDTYQGVAIGGYTKMVEKLLKDIDVKLNCDFLKNKEEYLKSFPKIIYTGAIDQFFDYKLGALEYRKVTFEEEILDIENFQGNAVFNYTSKDVPYTRIIEHKHFEFLNTPKTVISKEYSFTWHKGEEPYYPVNDDKNNALYEEYEKLSKVYKNVIFGGRLGTYKYLDMDKVVEMALTLTSSIGGKR